MNWSAYGRIARLDKPIGVLLLWYPTACALWFANRGLPPLKLIILFLLGTLLMRSAGCVMNDIADRHFDKHVARTKKRPLTSGEITLTEAIVLLGCLLIGALCILLNLPKQCLYLAFISLGLTVLYPFCKRFIDAPQLILGLTFSMGIPMAYAASGVGLDNQFIVLFLMNFAWIVAYDTMYAMADKEDDLLIGVKSTAIYFGSYDLAIIALLMILMQGLWFYWGTLVQATLYFYMLWIIAGNILIYQQYLISERKPEQCFKAFRTSSYYGCLMWLAVALA